MFLRTNSVLLNHEQPVNHLETNYVLLNLNWARTEAQPEVQLLGELVGGGDRRERWLIGTAKSGHHDYWAQSGSGGYGKGVKESAQAGLWREIGGGCCGGHKIERNKTKVNQRGGRRRRSVCVCIYGIYMQSTVPT